MRAYLAISVTKLLPELWLVRVRVCVDLWTELVCIEPVLFNDYSFLLEGACVFLSGLAD